MEIYRSAGIEAEIRDRQLLDDRSASVARMKNLADSEVSWPWIPPSDTSGISSTTAATCDQDQLEPILRAQAERHGADVRFNTELVSFTQSRNEVVGRIRDRSTGAERDVRAQYLIGADGTQSAVREAVGIRRHGPGILQHWMNVIFEADLPTVIDGRAIRSVFVTDINGTLVPRGNGRWLMAVQFVPDRGERVADFTPAHCRELIRRGAGRADLTVEIVDVRPWEAAAAVADRYQEGRVLLVGDSAHVMPPTGGFGGNTGIQDAYNLAWKLEAVVNGAARPELLETYDSERRPIADRTVAQSLARLQAWFKDPSRTLPPPEQIRDDNTVIFGYRYPAGAFVDDGRNATDDLFEDPGHPSGRPGSRAPHLVVTHRGVPVSTIDLFADRWVLLSGRDGNDWSDCVRRSSAARALGVAWYGVQPAGDLEDVANRFSTAYGVGTDGAILIRPDGFIAWRHVTAADGARALDDGLERLWIRTAVNTGGHSQ